MADYWFRQVAPLDRFRFTSEGLTFDDLAIEKNLDKATNVKYDVTIAGRRVSQGSETSVPITMSESPSKVEIRRLSPNWPDLKVAVTVQLVNGKPTVVGIQR